MLRTEPLAVPWWPSRLHRATQLFRNTNLNATLLASALEVAESKTMPGASKTIQQLDATDPTKLTIDSHRKSQSVEPSIVAISRLAQSVAKIMHDDQDPDIRAALDVILLITSLTMDLLTEKDRTQPRCREIIAQISEARFIFNGLPRLCDKEALVFSLLSVYSRTYYKMTTDEKRNQILLHAAKQIGWVVAQTPSERAVSAVKDALVIMPRKQGKLSKGDCIRRTDKSGCKTTLTKDMAVANVMIAFGLRLDVKSAPTAARKNIRRAGDRFKVSI